MFVCLFVCSFDRLFVCLFVCLICCLCLFVFVCLLGNENLSTAEVVGMMGLGTTTHARALLLAWSLVRSVVRACGHAHVSAVCVCVCDYFHTLFAEESKSMVQHIITQIS